MCRELCFTSQGVGQELCKHIRDGSDWHGTAVTGQGGKGVFQRCPLPSKGKRKQPGVPKWPSTSSLQSQRNLRCRSRECECGGLLVGGRGGIGGMNGGSQPTRTRHDEFWLSSCQLGGGQRMPVNQKLPLTNAWGLQCPLSLCTGTGMASREKVDQGEGKNPETDIYSEESEF